MVLVRRKPTWRGAYPTPSHQLMLPPIGRNTLRVKTGPRSRSTKSYVVTFWVYASVRT